MAKLRGHTATMALFNGFSVSLCDPEIAVSVMAEILAAKNNVTLPGAVNVSRAKEAEQLTHAL